MSPVAAGFTGSQIGTDEANDKNEEEVPAEPTPAESADPTPAEDAGTTGSTTESSPEEPPEGTTADPAEGDAEEHADVRFHDEGEGPATSGVRESGSVEYGA